MENNYTSVDGLDAAELEELDEQIRTTTQVAIRTLEIFYEELSKSSLPDNIKTALMLRQADAVNKQ